MSSVRDSYAWKKARKRALFGAKVCEICARPLDFDAPARSRWAPSVDHVVALAHGGDPFSQSNLRVAHVGCNSSLGAAIGNRSVRRVQNGAPWRSKRGLRPRSPRARVIKALEPMRRADWW